MQGETAAPHDVTSNVERSKHLHDPQEAKVYDAEVRARGGGQERVHMCVCVMSCRLSVSVLWASGRECTYSQQDHCLLQLHSSQYHPGLT